MEAKVNLAEWTIETEQQLQISAGDDLAIIKDDVANQRANLWLCQSDKNRAYVVTRIDYNELVIVLFEGSGLYEFMPLFIDRATELNLKIRAHIKRKGLIKMGQKLGFEIDEYILRKK